jgi:hypothetical protein
VTLKAKVKEIFVKPPCHFVFHKNDTEATGHDGAILQCKDDHTASLMCMMPRDMLGLVQRNTNLMIVLLLCAGWKDGDRWLAQCFREAKGLPKGKIFDAGFGGVSFQLVIDPEHALVTLNAVEK